MKVVHLNSVDISGGAAVASNRLHKGLRQKGVDSREVVGRKDSTDPTVHAPSAFSQTVLSKLYSLLDRLPARLYRGYNGQIFSTGWTSTNISEQVSDLNPDIVHLHWINAGFLRIEDLKKFDAPIVWTLHDMWPFTGGCHYSSDCTKYENRCGNCPVLGRTKESDLSRKVWTRKQQAWNDVEIDIIAPSKWMAQNARSSSLFDTMSVHQIPNGIDLSKYSPISDSVAQSLYNIPRDKEIILFGAANPDDPRKGYDYLIEALNNIRTHKNNVELVTFGSNPIDIQKDTTHDIRHIGRVDTVGLIALYSAANMFVIPSLEDNLPNTVLESLACGTPVVAFDVGGISDMISHKRNGYLASPRNATSLSDGIRWVLDRRVDVNFENIARKSVSQFNLDEIVSEHMNLYRSLAK
jgi:glycosyltransferase involved in cell wall biosynthesis